MVVFHDQAAMVVGRLESWPDEMGVSDAARDTTYDFTF